MKTLTQTILPRIALYKVLNQSGLSQEDVYRHMRNYMLDIVGTEKHLSMVKMERVPGIYFLYSNISFVLCEERICGTVSRPMEGLF
mgnify:CR=1 FL=1